MRRDRPSRRIARPAIHALLLAGLLALTAALSPRYGDALLAVARGPVATLDPAQAASPAERDLVANLFETLISEGPGGFLPGTAASWSVRPDSLEWTFQLRTGPAFSNGRPVTAAAYVDSWRRLGGPGPAGELLAGVQAAAPGPRTLVLSLAHPIGDLLRRLADPAAAAVEVVPGSGGESLLGSGPFRYAGMKGSAFLLAARTDHWAGRPFAGQVTILPAAGEAEARLAWERGFHIAHGFPGLPGNRAGGTFAVREQVQGDPGRPATGVLDLSRSWLLK